jgi:hypothetical protein
MTAAQAASAAPLLARAVVLTLVCMLEPTHQRLAPFEQHGALGIVR